MHSFLVGAVYVALVVITPCVIALFSVGRTEKPQDSNLARHDIAV